MIISTLEGLQLCIIENQNSHATKFKIKNGLKALLALYAGW